MDELRQKDEREKQLFEQERAREVQEKESSIDLVVSIVYVSVPIVDDVLLTVL